MKTGLFAYVSVLRTCLMKKRERMPVNNQDGNFAFKEENKNLRALNTG